jgi:UDP-N-acetylglucosamine:LPS N-acetylglucosamine transferase
VSLAVALRERLEHAHCIEVLDPQPRLIHSHYRAVSRHARWLWRAEYRATDSHRMGVVAHRLFARVVSRRLQQAFDRVCPQLVISTYPFLTTEVTSVLRRISRQIHFVMLFADPEKVHATWLTERHAAVTLAPTRETYRQALAAGLSPQHVRLTGWPVRRQFLDAGHESREETLTRLGLDPHCFTVFLQAGGEGSSDLSSPVRQVLAAHPRVQVILSAGTNEQLLKRHLSTPRVCAAPFTPNIARLMRAADVVMGKAGPNTLFETVTLGKPFIACSYIPGQESPNLAFIRRYNLGWVALAPSDQRNLIAELVTNSSRLRTKMSALEAYRRWNHQASERIPSVIASLMRA